MEDNSNPNMLTQACDFISILSILIIIEFIEEFWGIIAARQIFRHGKNGQNDKNVAFQFSSLVKILPKISGDNGVNTPTPILNCHNY
jgi:hypothetical protein